MKAVPCPGINHQLSSERSPSQGNSEPLPYGAGGSEKVCVIPKHGAIVWGFSLRSGSLPASLQALLLRFARQSGNQSNANKNGHRAVGT